MAKWRNSRVISSTHTRYENYKFAAGSIVRPLGHSIVYAVNNAILRLLAATLAPIVPLALTMMPLGELLKMLFGMLF